MTQHDQATGSKRPALRWTLPAAAVLSLLFPVAGFSQLGGSSGTPGATGQGTQQHQPSGMGSVQAAEQTFDQIPTSAGSTQVTQQDYKGSLVEGKATDGVLELSLDDAIQRGFRTNLGIILQGAQTQTANAQRLQ